MTFFRISKANILFRTTKPIGGKTKPKTILRLEYWSSFSLDFFPVYKTLKDSSSHRISLTIAHMDFQLQYKTFNVSVSSVRETVNWGINGFWESLQN